MANYNGKYQSVTSQKGTATPQFFSFISYNGVIVLSGESITKDVYGVCPIVFSETATQQKITSAACSCAMQFAAEGAQYKIVSTNGQTPLLFSLTSSARKMLRSLKAQEMYRLVAAGNKQIWLESLTMPGKMVELVAARNDIDTTRPISIFGLYGKAFVVNESRKRVIDFRNVKLSHSALTTPHLTGDILMQNQGGGAKAYMVVDFTNASKTATYGYAYYEGGATSFNTVNSVSGNGGGSSFTPSSVDGPPHWYEWTPYPTAGTRSFGSMPEFATLGCAYRGRAVLSGNKLYPYQWYMSRQANTWDWLYAAADSQSPVAGNNADAGQCGDVITALAPFQDDYLIFGCATQIWVLRGDPAAGGSMDQLSYSTGIYGPRSFCWDSNHNFYFWGHSGIYRIRTGLSAPELITLGRLPNIVSEEELNPLRHRITMGYDFVRNGILIAITNIITGENKNYWYDVSLDAFYREEYPVSSSVFSMAAYTGNDPSLNGLLLGCSDGYIRRFNETQKDDEDTSASRPIVSRGLIGPVQIGKDTDSRSRVKTLALTTGTNTDSIDYKIYAADTAEEVVDKFTQQAGHHSSGTLNGDNRVKTLRERVRGAWIGIELANSLPSQTWSFENLVADIKEAGDL